MKCIHFRRGILLFIKPGCLHHGTPGIAVEAVPGVQQEPLGVSSAFLPVPLVPSASPVLDKFHACTYLSRK